MKKWVIGIIVLIMLMSIVFATGGTGDVAGAIESTWKDASSQIKTVVNNVVFPIIDCILAVFFFHQIGDGIF